DQFERVFAADGAQERAERTAFVDALNAAAAHPAGPRGEPPARVVIAVRGDYWDRCAALPQLVGAKDRDQLVVGPMPDAGRRRAITGRAGRAGCAWKTLSLTRSWPTQARSAPRSPCSPR